MDRNVPLDPEITEPPAAAAKAGPAVDPYVIASAAEAAEANVDYAPAAEYFGRLLGGWPLMSDHYQPQQCTACGGSKGHTETSFDANGVRHDTWRSCSSCGGTGVR